MTSLIIPGHSPWKTMMKFVKSLFALRKKLKNMLNCSIKAFQCDEGGEYTKHAFQNYMASNGITQRFSCPKHQNGSVEWKHQHLVETTIVLMSHACVPSK